MQYFMDPLNNLFAYEDTITGDLLNLFITSNHLTPYTFPIPLSVSIISQVSPTLTSVGSTVFSITSSITESLTVFTQDRQILSLESNTNYTLIYPYNSNISINNNNKLYPLISHSVLSQSVIKSNIPQISSFNYSVSGNSITATPSSLQASLVIQAIKSTAGSYLNYATLISSLSSLIGIPESFIIATLQNSDVADIEEIFTTAIGKASTTTNPTLSQIESMQSICQIYGL